MLRICLITICLYPFVASAVTTSIDYPGKSPGKATAVLTDEKIILKNEAVSAEWQIQEKKLRPASFSSNANTPEKSVHNSEVFTIQLINGTLLKTSDFMVADPPVLERIPGRTDGRRLVERYDGVRVRGMLTSVDRTVSVEWEAELRDDSNYIIQRITLVPEGVSLPLETVTLIELEAPDATVCGITQGAPVVADPMFFAVQHPMSDSRVDGGRVSCSLHRGQVLEAGQRLQLSSVLGATPARQLRRGYLYYVERERAHPYRPFLHYNSWYDIAWGDRKFNEAQAMAAIETMARELVVKRKVKVDSFVFDDGWDDNTTLWQFHAGFPTGFAPLTKIAENYGSAVGTWLSPFGGYGEAREQRLAYGTAQGFEINRNGFSLSGERYYARFHEICAEMISQYGVNFFKFDGMGPGNDKVGGEEFLEDIEALMRLCSELRELDTDLYISATTGTWCSPYYLWHADNTWRCSSDMDFCGKGSKRQQWINYRDTHTYRNVVCRGPLYPLNSLMTQGIVHGSHGPAALMDVAPKDFADEVWSFFGSGTNLQELYITPQLLTEEMWNLLAAGATWSRAQADVLVDVHWIGGDPGEHQVYGWAAWAPRKGIVVLRNPDDKAANLPLDIGEAFELPLDACKKYQLVPITVNAGADTVMEVIAGTPHIFQLEAFQTLVYEAIPTI